MPALPQARLDAYLASGLSASQAALITASREVADFTDRAARASASPARLSDLVNWIVGPLSARLNEENLEITRSRISPEQLASLDRRVADGTLSSKLAKEVFDAVWAGEGDVDAIIAKRGLKQISDSGELEAVCDQVIAANAQQVADYRGGKERAFNSLVGQVMKLTRGKANPQQVAEILKRKLA
jgi:aspartyl-tRNA(Asn)/glutamyl-tRNA(Gln) amidotransferase subunit B